MNNGTGRVWAVNANGGDEGRPNGVGPVYIENIDKIGGGVPDPSGASTGDVLTVDSQGNPAWEPPTGGGGSYTAGNGIEIENNQISVDTDVVATKSDLPDMSEYATESELTSGLAEKQDVISDLATIRSGASLGSTAVQPAALNDYATTSALTSGLAAKQDTISDLSTIRTGASAGATAVQPGDLATVATTGSYADLSNKPSLATVATSGSYDDLSNKPSIPAAQVQTDWDAVSGIASIANKPNLATVATSGSYNDLSDKPSIPAAVTVDQHYDALSANAQSGTAVAEAIAGTGQVPTVTSADDNKVLMASYSGGVGSFAWEPSAAATQVNADWEASSGVAEILHKPDLSVYAQSANLATVATSGDYNDLSNRPTIPAAQVNADWNANSGVSQILNKPTLATVATSGDYDDLQNKPTIPAAQVQSDWDAVSGVSAIANKPDLSVYATTSDLTSGLAAKQDTISDLSTIRSGAALGSTAVQPGSLATVATSGNYNDLSNRPTIPTVDQTYNASSTNAQSGTAVASAIAGISIDEVPAVTSSDDGKILQASYSGGTGSYAWANPEGVTVDQTYNASSANAQSGTAVAGALANYTPTASLATVATTGNYNDLTNKPAFPIDQSYNPVSANAQSGMAVAEAIGSALPDTKPVVAGSNITITENTNDITISATDTTYSAGTGISISSGTISNSDPLPSHTSTESGKVLGVDSNGALGWVNQSGGSSYVAGNGINISNDTISVDTTVVATQSDLSNYTPTANLATVATTGAYSDLTGTPSTTALVAGANVTITEGANDITISATNTTYSAGNGLSLSNGAFAIDSTVVATQSDLASYTPTASLATVATTGDYTDLSNKPSIPSGAQLVPAATSADADKVLTVDSLGVPEWAVIPSQPTGLFEAVYGQTTYADIAQAITDKRIVYCRIETSSAQARMAFLAYKGNGGAEFQYYRSNSTESGADSVFVYQVNKTGWTTTERPVKAGNISYPVTQVNVNGSSAMTGTVANITIPAAPTVDQTYNSASTNAQSGAAVAGALATVDDVPAVTSADDGKVLKASYSGGTGSYAWEAGPTIVGLTAGSNITITEGNNTITIAATDTDTTYSAGNMIAINSANNNAIGVSTTAGITDIQIVAALPAQPVATVLYLIQET